MLKQMVKNHQTFIGLPGAYAGTEVVVMSPAELEEKLAAAREDTTGEVAALLQTIAAYRPDWFPPVVYRFEVGNNQRWCVGWPTPTTEDKHPPLYEDCNDLREGLRSLLAQVREAARPAPAPSPCACKSAEWYATAKCWWWQCPNGKAVSVPPGDPCPDCHEPLPPKPVAAMTDAEVETDVDQRLYSGCTTICAGDNLWRARGRYSRSDVEGNGSTARDARRDLLRKLREQEGS